MMEEELFNPALRKWLSLQDNFFRLGKNQNKE